MENDRSFADFLRALDRDTLLNGIKANMSKHLDERAVNSIVEAYSNQPESMIVHEIINANYNNEPMYHFTREHFKVIKRECTCGAKHTSFPNFHSSWCDRR